MSEAVIIGKIVHIRRTVLSTVKSLYVLISFEQYDKDLYIKERCEYNIPNVASYKWWKWYCAYVLPVPNNTIISDTYNEVVIGIQGYAS